MKNPLHRFWLCYLKRTNASGVRRIFLLYWKCYGGIESIRKSPYLHAAFILSIIALLVQRDFDWAQSSLDIFPDILGFTLGGFTILLAFGDRSFLSNFVGKDPKNSELMKVNATFVHFVILQATALIYSIIFGSDSRLPASVLYPIDFLGTLLFFYALLSVLAVTMAAFRLGKWLSHFIFESNKKDHQRKNDEEQ